MTRKSKKPCYGCSFREVGCHTNCKAYKEYRKLIEKIGENRQKENPIIGYLVDKRWR